MVKIASFLRSNYEFVFAIFMAVLAYLYRYAENIQYPEILYWFFVFIAFNYLVSRNIKKKERVNLWLIEALLAANSLMVTFIMSASGGADSYFWVLFFLPVFTASFSLDSGRILLIHLFIFALLFRLNFSSGFSDVRMLVFSVEFSLISLVGVILRKVASANIRLENMVEAKRERIAKLSEKIAEKDSFIIELDKWSEAGKMFAELSHDLGNMLAVIMMSAEIMRDTGGGSRKELERILNSAKLAKKFLAEVVRIAREGEYEFKTVPLKSLLEESVNVVSKKASAKNVNIKVKIIENLRVSVSGVQFERVLINCLLNSVSFMEKGTIEIVAGREGSMAFVSIRDEGPGFPADIIRGGVGAFKSLRKDKTGTGLGLLLAKEIVEKHKGEILLFNRKEGGAEVRILLPLPSEVEQ